MIEEDTEQLSGNVNVLAVCVNGWKPSNLCSIR